MITNRLCCGISLIPLHLERLVSLKSAGHGTSRKYSEKTIRSTGFNEGLWYNIHMQSNYKKSLFWDVDSNNLSSEKDWFFIIERILEFGNIDDFFMMKKTFSEEQIKAVIQKSRILSSRTRSYCNASGYAS